MLELLPGAREIVPGLWRWTAYHPAWKQDVGCVALVSDDELVLVDPLIPDEPAWEALGRAVKGGGTSGRSLAVVLTVFWHERSACEVLQRHPAATLWADLDESGELACEVTNRFHPGERLPGGLEAFRTGRARELVLWEPRTGTLIPGDVILGTAGGALTMCPVNWLPDGMGHAGLRKELQPLLVLPIRRVLVSHGEPVLRNAREQLARATGGVVRS